MIKAFSVPRLSPGGDTSASRKGDSRHPRACAARRTFTAARLRAAARACASARPRVTAAALAAFGLACAPSDREPGTDALEDTLRQRIEQAYDFTRPDIVDRMASLYPDTGRVISASGGHVMTTVDSLRQGLADFWANVGTSMQEPVWQWDDVHVDRLGDDAAALTGTWSIAHTAPTGDAHTIHGAWTAVFRRIDGEWKIVQEHLSVPPVVQ